MIPEIGHFALILALSLAVCQGVIPLLGAYRNDAAMMAAGRTAANGQLFFVAFAFGALVWAFVQSDFSVLYVANHSQLALPTVYKISAVWGAHEGSLLMWILILAIWTVSVGYFSHNLPKAFSARVIGVLGLLSTGFLLFTLLTSNPFERLTPAPADGGDLNPLLQDPGLAIHPPILYAGYVGFSVAFAFAIAAMLSGNLDRTWAKWTRPWTTVAWLFLTIGIALGSWWAYYELGWGGWWFWDPVENASFMPWLLATALIHSQAVTEQRGGFRAWTVLLAIFGFSLSLLGTFLVRSGVLVSVHAFATDPTRGVFILGFLVLVVGGALTLFAWRGAKVSGGGSNALFSRDTLLLVNNVVLVVASGSVLLGTLYPLIVDAMSLGKISVGPPYFNAVFVPLMLPLALLVGLGPMVRWKSDDWRRHARRMWPLLAGSVALAAVWVWFAPSERWWLTLAGIATAFWIVAATALSVVERLRHARADGSARRRLRPAFVGMSVAHLGFAVTVLGITGVSAWNDETDLSMREGGTYEYAGYTFRFGSLADFEGPNYRATRGHVELLKDGQRIAMLTPEKRLYTAQPGNPMTEASIDASLARDVFVALGEPLGDGAWAVRVQHKPLIRLIWLGPIIMALGGLIAVSDRRYRLRARVRETDAGAAAREPARGVAAGEAPAT